MAIIIAIQGWSQITLNESFEGTTFPPENWRKENLQGITTPWIRSTHNPHNGTAHVFTNYNSSGSINYLITPKLTVTANNHQISFWAVMDYLDLTYNQTFLKVLVSTTTNDISSFDTAALLQISPSFSGINQMTDIYKQWTVDLSAYIGQDIYIAFRQTDNDGYGMCLDDVVGPELFVPACPKPTALTTANITTNSADISWTSGNSTDSTWWFYWKEINATNYDSIYVTTIPYTLQNLNPNSVYNVYIATDCGSELSPTSNVLSFRTSCESITTLPYIENFDSHGTTAGTFPSCWFRPVLNTATPYPSIVTANAYSAPANLRFQSSSITPTYAITPAIDIDINTLKVRFMLKAESIPNSGVIEVGIMSDPNVLSSFELVTTIQPTSTAYTEYEVLFDNTTLTGTGNHIAFRHVAILSSQYYWLDNVIIDRISFCTRPDSLYAANITQNEAEISFTPGDIGDTQWKLYYRQVGDTSWIDNDVISIPYQITGLTSNTTYEVFVKTICNGTIYSDASSILSFHTPCDNILTLPYTENFDSYGTGTAATSFPNCWSRNVITYSTPNYPYIATINYSSPGAMFFQASNNTRTVAVANPIDPSIPVNMLTVSFKMRYSILDNNGIQVGVMSDPNDFSTFVPIGNRQTISDINVWEDKTVILSDYTGTGQYIALAAIAPAGENARAYVDDFVVDYTPNCPSVFGLTVGVTSTTSININWDNSNDLGDGFNIAYSTHLSSPFDPITANIIFIPTGTTLPYIISGLTAGDTVWVAIQRGCNGDWTDAQKVNLPAFAHALPYTCDFEDNNINNSWTIINGAQANKWFIGVSGANGIGNGLYISSNNGLSASYAHSSSVTMVSTFVQFDNSTDFALAFDWRAGGESSNDYISAYIIPIGVPIEEGILPSAIYKVTPTYLNLSTSWQRQTISLGSEYSNSIQRVVFAWRNNGSGGIQPGGIIDNIQLLGLTCPSITDIVTSNITSTSANISWNSNLSTATNWWIYWKEPSATNWIDSLNITQNPYTLNGLLPNTPYQVKILNNCGTELSFPMNILSFRTACDIISIMPYTENFDNHGGIGTDYYPPCWSKITNYTLYPHINSTYHSAPASLYFYAISGTSNIAILPEIDASIPINTLMATFWMKTENTTSNIIVGVMDSIDASTFTPIDTVAPVANAIWEEIEVDFSSYSGIGKFIAFKSEYNTASNYLYLDDVIIDYIPSCYRPTSLSATGIGTSMNISFIPNNLTDNGWYIYYKPVFAGNWDSVLTTTIPTTISGLELQTTYQIYAKAICSDGTTSNASQTITYTTSCSSVAISSFPWTENFEGGISCWTQEYVIGTTSWTNALSDYMPHTGIGIATFFNSSGNKTKLVSQLIDLSLLYQPYISFWHMQRNWAGSQDELKVMYRASQDSAWTQLVHYTSDIPDWQYDSIALPSSSSTYQIAFEGYGDYGYGVALDDIIVYDLSAYNCPPPTNLTVSNIQNNTATINWVQAGTESEWQVCLGTISNPVNVTSTTYTFPPNLTIGTSYIYFVRAKCGTSYSSWVSGTFTTTELHHAVQVTTISPTAVTQTNATFHGTYVQGSEAITAIGFEYKTTVETNWTDQVVTPVATTFTYQVTTLTANTNYQVRAYAVTPTDGRIYGDALQFTTSPIEPPTVTTLTPANVTQSNVTFNGTIIQGSEAINARGFEYKLITEDWADATILSATGTNTISAEVNNLQSYTNYNVRAYARTVSDTYYGQELNFQTLTLTSIDQQPITIMIYPNPASQETKLVVTGLQGEVKITISDIQGRIINTINTKSNNNKVEETLNISDMAKGVYYVRLQNEQINRTQKLIVK